RNDEPGDVLERFVHEFVERHRRRVEPHARGALALDLALDPQEQLGVYRLRTGIAAPQAPGDRGKQEQRQRRDDQQHREVDDVLRPEHPAEDVELARRQVEKHRLAPVPGDPRQAVEDRLGEKYERPAPARERAVHRARIDLLAYFVEPDLVGRGLGGKYGSRQRSVHELSRRRNRTAGHAPRRWSDSFYCEADLMLDRLHTYAASSWILPSSRRSLCAGILVTAP